MTKTPVTYKETSQGILEIHDVELGIFQPPHYFQVRAYMKNWEDDLTLLKQLIDGQLQK